MKKRIVIIAVILFISISVSGKTFSWFTTAANTSKTNNLATIKLNIIQNSNSIKIQNAGTGEAYIRVRLIPQWSNPDLSVANAVLNLNTGNDWTSKQSDGYYYFKEKVKSKEITNSILKSITFENLEPEYSGESFTLNVVAEGVQTNKTALKDVWGISSLPFN